ncbi:MAG: leucine-rich repeat domain-containing protein, partial [Oscillospiraceae bacterium]|nr:leucine-rich repeat domain-containing protein [Oscillospiraceae bacterium]
MGIRSLQICPFLTVTKISKGAFSGCTNLESVTITNNIKTIEPY